MKYFSRFVLLLAAAGLAHAAPVSRNLGQGLAYHRVHQLPTDLPTAENARRQPCILDLRYVAADAEAAGALAAWLKFHATAQAPVFVLANSSTSAAVLSVVAPHANGPSVVVVGAASSDFTPDIALKISAESDRRAYDAFENGATTDSLLTENPNKPRNDEAKLAKDRQPESISTPGDSTGPAPPASDAAPSTTDGTTKPKPPAPPVDAVLQRAVQLHRALLALKKL